MTVPYSTRLEPTASALGFQAYSPAELWGRLFIVVTIVGFLLTFAVGFDFGLGLVAYVGFLGAFLGLRYHVLGTLSIGVLCTLDPLIRIYLAGDGLIRWNSLNYLLVLAILTRLPSINMIGGWTMLLLKALIALLLAETLISRQYAAALQHMLHIVCQFGIIGYLIHTYDDDDTWHWLGIVTGTAGALIGISFHIVASTLMKADHNATAMVQLGALVCLVISYSLAMTRNRILHIGILVAINLILIFLSGSRGTLVLGGMCAAYLIWISPGLSQRVAILLATVLVAFVVMGQFENLGTKSVQRISKTFDSEYSIRSRSSGRSDLFFGAWNIFKDHPFGVGTGGFAKAWANLGNLDYQIQFKVGREFSAHSAWMKVLVENGIPGFVLLFAYVMSFGLTGLTLSSRELRGLGILATGILSMAFLTSEFQGKAIWMIASTATLLAQRRGMESP